MTNYRWVTVLVLSLSLSILSLFPGGEPSLDWLYMTMTNHI